MSGSFNQMGHYFDQPYQCSLSDELQLKAKVELFEVPRRRLKDVQMLRDWLKTQHHICCRQDDVFLLTFLRSSKFSLERTKVKLDLYHTLISHCPEQLRPQDPRLDPLKAVINSGAVLPMPEPLPDGRGLLIIRPGRRDPDTISQDVLFLASNMIRELWLEECESIQVCGIVGIVDLEGVTVAHAISMTPTCVKKAVTIWEASPLRQKGIHYVNVPPFSESIVNLFRRFMKEKLSKRLHVHSSPWHESLHQYIPIESLPKEYGGKRHSLETLTQYWCQKMQNNADRFAASKSFGVDEKLRQGPAKRQNDLFGTEGSFRQLEID